MAFVAEDGTGVSGANAYALEATITSVLADRGGHPAWDVADSPTRQAAIIRATDYIEARWGNRFLGRKLRTDQGLSFPRSQLYDREGQLVSGIPFPFQIALAEYTKRALGADLWNEPIVSQKGRLVTERAKVGPIEEDTRYAFNRSVSEIKPVPGADRLILQYCSPAGSILR